MASLCQALMDLAEAVPDLNPDEFVWNRLRHQGVSKKRLKGNESLRTRVEHGLQAIEKDRRLVKSFFMLTV